MVKVNDVVFADGSNVLLQTAAGVFICASSFTLISTIKVSVHLS